MSRLNNLRNPLVVVLTTALLTTAAGSPAFAQSDPSPSESTTATNNSSGFETRDTDGGIILTGLGSVEITDGQLRIPATIDGKKVVEIADNAFKDAGLKSLVFDDGVELARIGNSAFQGNELDGDVDLEVSVIGDNAFAQNKLKSVTLHNVTEIGNDAFRDNEVTNVSFSTEDPVEIKNRAFANNRIKDTVDLQTVGSIGTEAFSANFITRAQLGKDTQLSENVFINNKSWVVLEADASDSDKGIVTTEYASGYGQVVNPVSIVIHYTDADGKTVHPDEVKGDDLRASDQAFEKGVEATLTPRQLSGYTLDTEKLTFTPDRDRFEVTATYTKIPGPTLTIPGKYSLKNGEKPTDEFFRKGVKATSGDDDITDKVKIDFSAVDENTPGVYPVIFSVVDANGNETVETANVSVGINYPDYEVGGGWQIKDFTYDGSTVTGFSDSGQKKLDSGKTELWIPPFNEDGTPVTEVGEAAFIRKGVTSIKDWGGVTEIGAGAFAGNRQISLPSNWGEIILIGAGAFANVERISLPDDWGNVTSIGEYAFQHNQITSLPNSWGKVTEIGDSAFSLNQLTSLPDDWGK